MFVFGHIGIGRAMVRPWQRAIPALPFIVGALLPDLIDKPLYYVHLSNFISATRTFGHTGLMLGMIFLYARLARSRAATAVGLGVATHLLLDGCLDLFSRDPSSEWIAFTWPILHTHFAHYDFLSMFDHLVRLWNGPLAISEAIGLSLLGWEAWRSRATQGPR